jgi:16S rRNA A1518/A1519 N6-dimethyltransferase RsmA/KsgA/DIM1 with predicted DNA glycosylase/AP lyase activity
MIEAANLKDGQHVYDIGCGDGRLLIEALKKKKINAHGVEINLFISSLAKLRLWMSEKKAVILRKNFFKVSLRESDVVFCYLFPKVMQKLKIKFQDELKKGAVVISYCFPIKDWKPTKTIQTRADKPKNFLIYVYQMPCERAE